MTKKASRRRENSKLSFHKWTGQWYKTIAGKRHYLGTDHEEALARLEALRTGQATDGALTVKDLGYRFLDYHQSRPDISNQTIRNYVEACRNMADFFGRLRYVDTLRPADFVEFRTWLNERYAASTIKTRVSIVRMVFKFAADNELAPHPINLGSAMKAPDRKAVRKAAAGRNRVLTIDECRRLCCAGATFQLIPLLCLSAALGPADLAGLQGRHIEGDWLNYPRPKTSEPREAWLWPEVVSILPPVTGTDPVLGGRTAHAFRNLLRRMLAQADIDHRPYDLRHTALTVMSQAGDDAAVRRVAGHSDGSMLGNYLHHLDRQRVRSVCQFWRSRLLDIHPDSREAGNGLRVVG